MEELQKKTIVVTGARFIGNYLCKYFGEKEYNVMGIARSPKPLMLDTKISWFQLKAPDELYFPKHVDVLIHCASIIPAKTSDGVSLYEDNLSYSKLFFKEAVSKAVGCIIFTSSMSVYGKIFENIVTEDTKTFPVDSYGKSKLDVENVLKSFLYDYNVPSLSIRLPGTVGKGSHNNFISKVVDCILEGKPVRYSNPNSLFNNIVHVHDLAIFLERYIKRPKNNFVITNLAASEPLEICEIIKTLAFGLKKNPTLQDIKTQQKSFLISTKKAISLGYHSPSVSSTLSRLILDYADIS